MVHEDYFYFKSRGYSMQCQALIDRNKKFLDVVVGMLASTNNSLVLKCSSLHWQAATLNQLFDGAYSQKGFSPFRIMDKEYPLYPWLLTPYHDFSRRRQCVAKRLYNGSYEGGGV